MSRHPLGSLRERVETSAWLDMFVVNADNYRHPGDQVGHELRAMATAKPAVIGVVEALGNHLPELPGYTLIRDTSTPSRANIAAYVRDDLDPTHIQWHDLKVGWARTKYPGNHEPRSILTFRIGGRFRVIVAHHPPAGAGKRARAEHFARLVTLLNRNLLWPVALLWDANGAARTLAAVTGCRVIGRRVDCILARGAFRFRFKYLAEFDDPRGPRYKKVRFLGDHGDVLSAALKVPLRWITPQQPPTNPARLADAGTGSA